MRKDRDIVTDHAVIRFLERVYGVDIKRLKKRIATTTEKGREAGAAKLTSDGVRYTLRDRRVVSVEGAHSLHSNRAKRWKRRHK